MFSLSQSEVGEAFQNRKYKTQQVMEEKKEPTQHLFISLLLLVKCIKAVASHGWAPPRPAACGLKIPPHAHFMKQKKRVMNTLHSRQEKTQQSPTFRASARRHILMCLISRCTTDPSHHAAFRINVSSFELILLLVAVVFSHTLV